MSNLGAIRTSIPSALIEFAKPDRGWSRRTAVAFVTILLTLLLIRMPTPPVPNLSGSWSMALLYFHQHGFQFGRDVIFTYGPLGFLVAPTYFGQVPLLRMIWEGAANLAFAAALVNIGAKFFFARAIFYYSSLCLGVLLALPDAALDLSLPLFTIFWLLSPQATRWQIGLAIIWLAFLSLVKFNFYLEALVALTAASSLAAWQKNFGKAFVILALYTTTFVLLWLMAGQSPANLLPHVRGGLEITRGYVSAMALDELSPTGWCLIGALWLIIIGYAVDLTRRGRLVSADSIWLALYLAFAWFSLWKYGVTRADPAHVVKALACTMVIASAVPVRFDDRLALLDLVAPLCLVGVWVTDASVIRQLPQTFVQRVNAVADLVRPRKYAEAFSSAEAAEYRSHGHPALREIIGGAPVDMINCDQVEVLREKLNYRPRPVFQSYSAYTSWLLRKNLRFYLSAAAPQFIFARLESVDARYPTQEDALLLPELPRRYSLVQRGPDYVLLRRKPNQPTQDQAQRRLQQSIVSLRQEILLPTNSDCAVEMRARFQPTLFGRLREFFVQPALLSIVLTDEQHQEHRGRLVPEISAAGFLVQPLLESNSDLADFFQGRMRHAVSSLRFEPASGSSNNWSKIEVEFWELPELKLQHSSRPSRAVGTP